MHSSSIICAIKIRRYGSRAAGAICAEARCLWKIYISIGGEGYMVWTQTCQRIDKVTKSPSPPKHVNIQNVSLPVSTGNQSCHPQQHPLLKGDTEYLWYSIICLSTSFHRIYFLLRLKDFCFACLLAGALSAREKNKLDPTGEQYAHLNLLYDYVWGDI